MKSNKIFIAGKVTGLQHSKFNFENSENLLRYIYTENEVINPVKMGLEGEYYEIIAKYLTELEKCDKIFLQFNYYLSKGATVAYAVARFEKKEIIFEEYLYKEKKFLIEPRKKEFLTVELLEKIEKEGRWN